MREYLCDPNIVSLGNKRQQTIWKIYNIASHAYPARSLNVYIHIYSECQYARIKLNFFSFLWWRIRSTANWKTNNALSILFDQAHIENYDFQVSK